eukprot:NODE_439_length_8587_cov_0.367224.p2 type:complete len:409 gc:universal NODE_439_length_8587_cov_0.367224:6791-5565(-)
MSAIYSKTSSRQSTVQEGVLDKAVDKESTSLFSKLSNRKRNEDVTKRTLVPNRKERKVKSVHIQPHFNMRLIEEVVKSTPNSSKISLTTSQQNVKESGNLSLKDLENLLQTREQEENTQPVISTPSVREEDKQYVSYDYLVPYLGVAPVTRAKTILKTATDKEIVNIIDELNSLAQRNHQTASNNNLKDSNDPTDQFLRKLSYLTDSLVQPRSQDSVKFVSGNIRESFEGNIDVEISINDGIKVSLEEMDELFEKESTRKKSPIELVETEERLLVDKEIQTAIDVFEAINKQFNEMMTQTDEELLLSFQKSTTVNQECQTEDLLVMSNALVGQLWKLNEALTTKVREYDDAIIKQNDTVDELRERNKVLWNEVRFLRSKESSSEILMQTLNRSHQHQTLVRRDLKSKE